MKAGTPFSYVMTLVSIVGAISMVGIGVVEVARGNWIAIFAIPAAWLFIAVDENIGVLGEES